jgi:hypothetical protein
MRILGLKPHFHLSELEGLLTPVTTDDEALWAISDRQVAGCPKPSNKTRAEKKQFLQEYMQAKDGGKINDLSFTDLFITRSFRPCEATVATVDDHGYIGRCSTLSNSSKVSADDSDRRIYPGKCLHSTSRCCSFRCRKVLEISPMTCA